MGQLRHRGGVANGHSAQPDVGAIAHARWRDLHGGEIAVRHAIGCQHRAAILAPAQRQKDGIVVVIVGGDKGVGVRHAG